MTVPSSHIYVLDTSVLLSNPMALTSYPGCDVVLPLVVVKELEGKRHDPDLGPAARIALRFLESLRLKGHTLASPVLLPGGGTLRIEVNHRDRSALPEALRSDPSADTRILAVAAALRAEGGQVTLVSQDLPMRIIADVVVGIPAEEFHGDAAPESDHVWTGVEHVSTSKATIDTLYKQHRLDIEDVPGIETMPVNTGLILTAHGSSALGVITSHHQVQLVSGDLNASGVHGRSAEQRLALAHLLNPELGIVSVGGPGGTGKSVLALAAGIEAVLERRTHQKVVVFRPIFAVGGQDLGFLPGSELEKMSPWGAAVFDALAAFCSPAVVEEIIAREMLEVLPLTHIRGRTLTDTIVIVDEAQNLERRVLLTALSRIGANSRVFLTHDVAQRDNLRVGRHNGIAAVVERLKGEQLFAHIALTKSERSPVAALVTGLLDEFD